MTDALFEVPDEPVPGGRVEAGVKVAIEAAVDAGRLDKLDAGMIQGALLAARTLDRAETLPSKSAVYAIAQLMRPWQDAMHALRLPEEVAPASGLSAAAATESQSGEPSWLRDAFGTPGD